MYIDHMFETNEFDAPYEPHELPVSRTIENDLILLQMVKENNWELEEGSRLAILAKEINFFDK